MKNEITLDQARKVLEVVDAGLSDGMGFPVPGHMCVEAAVCYALGQPRGDEPECVNAAVRQFKIRLNDAKWSSNQARAKGMRKLAIAQLGTNDPSFDEKKFVGLLVEQTIRKVVPYALRCAIRAAEDQKHKAALEEAAVRCERDGDLEAAKNARRAAYAANADASTYAASTAATAAAAELANAGDYAPDAAADTANAAAASYRDPKDTVLCISADIGVQALRASGAHGIALMDQLIPA
jgi:hypothetical protein